MADKIVKLAENKVLHVPEKEMVDTVGKKVKVYDYEHKAEYGANLIAEKKEQAEKDFGFWNTVDPVKHAAEMKAKAQKKLSLMQDIEDAMNGSIAIKT